MLRIYWNSAHVTLRISRSRFWCLKLFLLNTYHLLGPNSSQNQKCSEIIEIWYIRYHLWCQKWFLLKICHLLRQKLVPKLKMLTIHRDFTHMTFRISWSRFWCQNEKPIANCQAQIGPKMKNALRIYWNLIKIEIW